MVQKSWSPMGIPNISKFGWRNCFIDGGNTPLGMLTGRPKEGPLSSRMASTSYLCAGISHNPGHHPCTKHGTIFSTKENTRGPRGSSPCWTLHSDVKFPIVCATKMDAGYNTNEPMGRAQGSAWHSNNNNNNIIIYI